jgi:hypothetical protein
MPAVGLLFGRPLPGYNARAAVDAETQIIVAHGLTQSMSDQHRLVALVDGIKKNLGRKPREASADAGYCRRRTSAPSQIAGSALTSQRVGSSTSPKPKKEEQNVNPRRCTSASWGGAREWNRCQSAHKIKNCTPKQMYLRELALIRGAALRLRWGVAPTRRALGSRTVQPRGRSVASARRACNQIWGRAGGFNWERRSMQLSRR